LSTLPFQVKGIEVLRVGGNPVSGLVTTSLTPPTSRLIQGVAYTQCHDRPKLQSYPSLTVRPACTIGTAEVHKPQLHQPKPSVRFEDVSECPPLAPGRTSIVAIVRTSDFTFSPDDGVRAGDYLPSVTYLLSNDVCCINHD
jgi:hypothetical protein